MIKLIVYPPGPRRLPGVACYGEPLSNSCRLSAIFRGVRGEGSRYYLPPKQLGRLRAPGRARGRVESEGPPAGTGWPVPGYHLQPAADPSEGPEFGVNPAPGGRCGSAAGSTPFPAGRPGGSGWRWPAGPLVFQGFGAKGEAVADSEAWRPDRGPNLAHRRPPDPRGPCGGRGRPLGGQAGHPPGR